MMYQQLLHGALCCSGGVGIGSGCTRACRLAVGHALAAATQGSRHLVQRPVTLLCPQRRQRRWRLQVSSWSSGNGIQANAPLRTRHSDRGSTKQHAGVAHSDCPPDTLHRCIPATA